jgi:hypothetical protein
MPLGMAPGNYWLVRYLVDPLFRATILSRSFLSATFRATCDPYWLVRSSRPTYHAQACFSRRVTFRASVTVHSRISYSVISFVSIDHAAIVIPCDPKMRVNCKVAARRNSQLQRR